MLRRNFFQIFAFVPALFASKVEAKQEEQIVWIGNDKYFCRNNKVFRLESKSGTTWYNELGQRHRENGPAVEYPDGGKQWYVNDQLHRTDGPAVELVSHKAWYINGQLHREDGPAIEHANGDQYWYQNNMLHCKNYPAVQWTDGTTGWYLNGKLHREDGPAIERKDGSKEWWINGQHQKEKEIKC